MAATFRESHILVFLVVLTAMSFSVVPRAYSEQSERDDLIRLQISEGLNLSGGMAAAVKEFYLQHERFPKNNQEAGLAPSINILGRYVISVAVGPGDGSIIIEYGNHADPIISGATLTLRATVEEPRLMWKCQSDYIDSKYLPVNCGIGRRSSK